MSVLDPTTLFVVGGLVILLCGISFLLETLLRRNDAVGRLWSVFFLSAIFSVFAYLVVSFDAENWWATAAGNGAFVAAVGLIWSGARRANGRRSSLIAVPVAVGALVALAAAITGPAGGFWAGSFEMFVGIAIVGGLGAFEFSRGDLAHLLAARVLSVLLGGIGIYYLGRAVVFATAGPDSLLFTDFFGTAASTLVEVCFAVVGTMMLSSIQGDRFSKLGEDDAEVGSRIRIDGILNASAFRELAETWLLRSIRERSTLVLLLVEVADLEAINTAFGRAAGDAAIRATGRIALTHASTASLVGHLSPRRFALLLELPSRDSVEAIAGRIDESVLGAMIDDQDRFRASTFCGVATTRTSGARYADLIAAAVAAAALAAEEAAAAAENDDVTQDS